MLIAVAIAAIVASGLVLIFAITADFDEDEGRLGSLVVAAVFMAIAGVCGGIDSKVRDPARAVEKVATTVAPAPGIGNIAAQDIRGFKGSAEMESGRLDKPLCLVQYYNRVKPGSRAWWTSCPYAKKLTSIDLVRKRLALPVAWGPRDARVQAIVPVGEDLTYMRGTAAPQCGNPGTDCLPGGGLQFRLTSFDPRWLGEPRCAASPDESITTRWAGC